MVLEAPGTPLRAAEIPEPRPAAGEVLVEVAACGICRTDLHVVDGELREPKLPLVPGHQIVGRMAAGGERFTAGRRVGVPWLGWTCGECRFCRSGRENLCDRARFTGYQRDGGFAAAAVADERFCFPIPDEYPDLQAAPLLCAGLIGHRALHMAGEAERLGLYGFGASAHIVCQVARTRGGACSPSPGLTTAPRRSSPATSVPSGRGALGPAPEELDAAIVFAPVGELVPAALRAVAKGGTVVCAGIHMSDLPSLPYELLWGERTLRSVANLTRADGEEFMALAPRVPVRTEVRPIRSSRPTRRSTACARGWSAAPRCWCPELLEREADEEAAADPRGTRTHRRGRSADALRRARTGLILEPRLRGCLEPELADADGWSQCPPGLGRQILGLLAGDPEGGHQGLTVERTRVSHEEGPAHRSRSHHRRRQHRSLDRRCPHARIVIPTLLAAT